ncbi:hypothetical protein ABZ915_02090 [Streptomyces sp. NPDC046915]|uniref:hypothetical protein n=1 Tax=Streptomyces sp. NPDC046915 TaxID=3155257 RepID=UPI0033CAA020
MAEVPVAFPVLLSAIGPAAGDRLVGLGDSVTSGRMLTAKDRPVWGPDPFDKGPAAQRQHDYQVPIMLSSHTLVSGRVKATVERLDAGDPAALPAKLGSPAAHTFVKGLHRTTVGKVDGDLDRAFQSVSSSVNFQAGNYWTVGPVAYRDTGDGLTARTRSAQPGTVWQDNFDDRPRTDIPEENADTQYRSVTGLTGTNCMGEKSCGSPDSGRAPAPVLHLVGRYDTAKLRGFSALSKVPLET